MGWTPYETRIEQLRATVGAAPAAAIAEIEATLTAPDIRPSDQARLLGLLSAARRHLGEDAAAEEALIQGNRFRRVSPLARAELIGQEAALRITQHRHADAILTAEHMLDLLPPPKIARTAWGKRQQLLRAALQASGHVLRGQARLVGFGDVPGAAADATAALESHPPRRQHLAAVVLLTRTLCRGGTVDDVLRAAHLLEGSVARWPPADRIVRAEARICRAVVVGRFGATARAEALILRSLNDYRELGAATNYRGALLVLDWLVHERDGRPGRAAYLRSKLRATSP